MLYNQSFDNMLFYSQSFDYIILYNHSFYYILIWNQFFTCCYTSSSLLICYYTTNSLITCCYITNALNTCICTTSPWITVLIKFYYTTNSGIIKFVKLLVAFNVSWHKKLSNNRILFSSKTCTLLIFCWMLFEVKNMSGNY